MLVFSLAACNGKDKGGGDGYNAFVKAMTDMKEAGDKLASEGLDFQAQSMYGFAGASLSSCRYAVEYILWLNHFRNQHQRRYAHGGRGAEPA
jgi:hypothetical protein